MSADNPFRSPITGPRDFATTHWSLVLAAGESQPEIARDALARLCEKYWFPLYAYARRQTFSAIEAEDLTQAFFAELLEKNYVASATPHRGRFRAFLLTAFKHFLAKQWEKARAQKRGGGRAALSLDFATGSAARSIDLAKGLTAEQLYDQQWAITLLESTMARLADEYEKAGKQSSFQVLREFLIGDHAGKTYADAAAALGTTESAAKKATSRMRKRYRELLRDEIAQTVTAADEVEDEIRNLFAVLEL